MELSRAARATMATAVVVGVFAYALVVELGVNAGRIHFGVSVRGADLGGLTFDEAVSRLEARATVLGSEPVRFAAEGFDVTVSTAEIGWRPRAQETAQEASSVGRSGPMLESAAERVRAYLSGVSLAWAGGPSPGALTALIDEVEDEALARGLELDRAKLRGKVKRLIQLWPRKDWYRLPVEG